MWRADQSREPDTQKGEICYLFTREQHTLISESKLVVDHI